MKEQNRHQATVVPRGKITLLTLFLFSHRLPCLSAKEKGSCHVAQTGELPLLISILGAMSISFIKYNTKENVFLLTISLLIFCSKYCKSQNLSLTTVAFSYRK